VPDSTTQHTAAENHLSPCSLSQPWLPGAWAAYMCSNTLQGMQHSRAARRLVRKLAWRGHTRCQLPNPSHIAHAHSRMPQSCIQHTPKLHTAYPKPRINVLHTSPSDQERLSSLGLSSVTKLLPAHEQTSRLPLCRARVSGNSPKHTHHQATLHPARCTRHTGRRALLCLRPAAACRGSAC